MFQSLEEEQDEIEDFEVESALNRSQSDNNTERKAEEEKTIDKLVIFFLLFNLVF